MAETVVSMARSMLGGAITMAASAATAEIGLLMGVRKDIWFIRDELETMQAFLVAAEAIKKKDMLLQVWAKQVRDLSYKVEDCLGEFMVHVGSQSLSQKLMKLKDRHRIAMQICDLKSRVEEVSNRNTRYNLIKTDTSTTIDEKDSYAEDIRKHSANNIDEAELVGFSKPKEELIKLMDVNNEDGLAKVICVVGMGGLGKTTLARKTYESKKEIAKKFSCCAWITVSQTFFKIELLKDMIKQLLGEGSLKDILQKLEGKMVQVDDLANYLREKLREKRYFVVLDDLWTIDAWRWIKDIAFPSNNMEGSRIIVTTRDVSLAKQCTFESHIYHLKPLHTEDAKCLLLKKTTKTREDMKKDEDLKNIVEELVKKCGCLPLAILTIGGILATKKVTEWRHFYSQLPSELETNPSLEALRRIVTMSYNHLPSHLKSCFLYLSIFPEDIEIQRRRLVERWIAEGFVKARAGVNIVDVGISYFNDLINRSMIQPSRVNIEGSVKSCRVHDIMRDVMVSVSRDENFVCIADGNETGIADNFFHIAYHGTKFPAKCKDWSHVRSLTMFGERPMEPSPSVCSPELRMLRTLDLSSAQFETTQKDIQNIGLLRHLKYLNVYHSRGYSSIYKLPRSIGKLQGLQILDLRNTYIATLPTEICKLQSLRTLRCCNEGFYDFLNPGNPKKCFMNLLCLPIVFMPLASHAARPKKIAGLHMAFSSWWSRSEGVKVPRGIGNLKELKVLETVDIKRTSSRAIEELGQLTLLRKLKVETGGATEKKCKILWVSIGNLPSLCSLRVAAGYYGTLEWLHSVSAPPLLLRSLTLYGRLGEEIPSWVGSLMQLVKIALLWSRVKEGGKIMEILGTLPNLILLSLGADAYWGEKLVFRTEAFPNLKQLVIIRPDELKEVRFEEGTSPHLERVLINICRLESGIIGIKHLHRLKEISLGWGGKVARLGVLQSEMDAHPNKPVLQLRGSRSYHDLGDIVQGSDVVQVEKATEEESSLYPGPAAAAAGESSSQAVILKPMTSSSQDDVLHTYNSC